MHLTDRLASLICVAMSAGLLFACEVPPIDASAAPGPSAMDELEPINAAVLAAIEAHDLKTAHDLLLPFAAAGNYEAQFAVGLIIYRDVRGQILAVDQSEREHRSMSWIRKAAGNGNEVAVRQMYSAYERGWHGLPKSAELEECWRRVVTFDDGYAYSDLSIAALCMDADAHLFQ